MDNKLKVLGLSKLEIKIYKELLKSGAINAKQLASRVGIVTQGLYRPLRCLVERNLVMPVGKHPAKYETLPLEVAADKSVRKIKSLVETPGRIGRLIDSMLPFRIITNRKSYHKLGERYFKQTKSEVWLIASGTGQLSPDFTKTMFDAVTKGVDYRIIALSYGELNKDKIENWKKNRFRVRHKVGKGVNLVIYDRKIVQIGLRVQGGSREKVGLIIFNRSLAEFLGEFYDYLWGKAERI